MPDSISKFADYVLIMSKTLALLRVLRRLDVKLYVGKMAEDLPGKNGRRTLENQCGRNGDSICLLLM